MAGDTPKFVYAVGRRKQASARVRLFKGKGQNMVNGKPVNDYFSYPKLQTIVLKPLAATNSRDKRYFTAKTDGGGLASQAAGVALGVARALSRENEEFKPILRELGLLTRDPRVRQRRMVGMGGKARRKKQSPKR